MAEIRKIFRLKPKQNLLLSYQQEAVRRLHNGPLFVCEKSRRTGMTWAFASEAVMLAAAAKDAKDVYYLSYNYDMTREFMDNCADFAALFASMGHGTGFVWDKNPDAGMTRGRISFPSGKVISALPSSPRSLRGKQGLVIVDEAAFHDDLPGVIKSAVALTMWGGRLAVISTHNGAENEFFSLLDTIRSGRRPGETMRITLKEALARGLFQRICQVNRRSWTMAAETEWETELRAIYGEAANEELDVVAARGATVWLGRKVIEAAMTADHPVLRLIPPPDFGEWEGAARTAWMTDWIEAELAPQLARFDPDHVSYFGQDFARSTDLSVIAAGQFDDRAVLQCRVLIEMRGVPFREQKQLLDTLCETMPRFTAGKMDARGNGQQLAEEMGVDFGRERIEGVMATSGTYLAMMPRLKARIEDRTIAMPRSEGVIDDLRLIRLVNGVPRIVDHTDDRTDGAKGRRHGDAAIALMHLVAAADEDRVDIVFESLGTRDSINDTRFIHDLNHSAPGH